MDHQETKLNTCKQCKGSGRILWDEETGEMANCPNCQSFGYLFPQNYTSYDEDDPIVLDSGMRGNYRDETDW